MKKLKAHHDGQDEDDFSSRQAAFQQEKEVQLFTTRQVSALFHSGIEPYPPIA